MKKLLYAVMTVMVMFTVTSCNQKGGSISNNPKAKALDDSISQIFGEGLGKTIAMHVNDTTPEAKRFDKEAFLAGLKDALKNDTTPKSQSYTMGMGQGMQMLQQIEMFDKMYGINFDKKIFIENFEKNMNGKVNEAQLRELDGRLQKLMQEAQAKNGKGNPMMMGGAPQAQPAKVQPATTKKDDKAQPAQAEKASKAQPAPATKK